MNIHELITNLSRKMCKKFVETGFVYSVLPSENVIENTIRQGEVKHVLFNNQHCVKTVLFRNNHSCSPKTCFINGYSVSNHLKKIQTSFFKITYRYFFGSPTKSR